jgi:hypothetical protein
MNQKEVIVIGAGAAGMMAAITAAREGAKVTLIEKMEKAGRKIRITGKGRCNITNTKSWQEFSTHLHPNSSFLKRLDLKQLLKGEIEYSRFQEMLLM